MEVAPPEGSLPKAGAPPAPVEPGFSALMDLVHAARLNGWHVEDGAEGPWRRFRAGTAPGWIALAALAPTTASQRAPARPADRGEADGLARAGVSAEVVAPVAAGNLAAGGVPVAAGAPTFALRAAPALLNALGAEAPVGAAPIALADGPALGAASSLALHQLCARAHALARSLPEGAAEAAFDAGPEAPLAEMEAALRARGLDWPEGQALAEPNAQPLGPMGATEAEALVRRRVGQDVFRVRLLAFWGGRCPLTGVADPALLRASHIVPWRLCASDAERLDVHNGLLLSAHWDAAFDAGLVTFTDDGRALPSPRLSPQGRAALRIEDAPPLPLAPAHRARLMIHRDVVFQAGEG